MANRHKGDVAFVCDGKDYTLRFSANALCDLEDQLDRGINEISVSMAEAHTLRLKTIRAVFWAGLRDHHPETSLADAGEIITALGGVVPAVDLIVQAFTAAFPDAAAEGGKGGPPKPGHPTPGTGPAS